MHDGNMNTMPSSIAEFEAKMIFSLLVTGVFSSFAVSMSAGSTADFSSTDVEDFFSGLSLLASSKACPYIKKNYINCTQRTTEFDTGCGSGRTRSSHEERFKVTIKAVAVMPFDILGRAS